MKYRLRIAFALLFSCSAAFAADGKTPDHTAIVMVSSKELPALEEDVYMFNSRSGYSASAVFSVGVKKRPDPHKEYILCHSSVAWSGGGLGLEELYDEKGEVNEWSIRVTADRASQWGAEHAVEAKVSFYETLENPPPGEGHSHSLLAEASDSVTVVAPEVKIRSISFNHTPGSSAGDGIDLQNDSYEREIIKAPEWTLYETKSVAYRAGVVPTVKVDFDLKPDRLNSVRVKAEEGTKGFTLCGGLAEAWGPASNASFTGAGVVEKKVDKGDLKWTWSATGFNGIAARGWDEFQITSVPAYKVLDNLQTPWKEGSPPACPWVNALDFVMDIFDAKGATEKKDAITRITKSFRANERWGYSLDPSNGWAESSFAFYGELGSTLKIYYDQFIDLENMIDDQVNCADSAAVVCASAALLGMETYAKRQKPWGVGRNAWDYHFFSIYDGKVYDACKAILPVVVSVPEEEYGTETPKRELKAFNVVLP